MEKIRSLRKKFKIYKLDGYLVPKNDEFFGEYIPNYKDNLKYISNFTGSYGFALILKNENYLFIDGRYTLQARKQSKKLFNIITMPEKLPSDILKKRKLTIGFDPKLHTELTISRIFKKSMCRLIPIKQNLINDSRVKKNKNTIKEFFLLKDKEAGKSSKKKINELSRILYKNKVDLQFVTASENIAWLLNIRGNDCEYSPLPEGYLLIGKKKNVVLFANLKKINSKMKKKINHIKIYDIKTVDNYLHSIKNKNILVDELTCSIYFKNIIKKNNKITNKKDLIYSLKSIKNKIEIQNTKKAHISDGAALTKFLFWIKNNFDKLKITELDAQKKLLKFRKLNKNFKCLSFPTISGTGSNAAIIHYKANKKSNKILKAGDLYLVDSGGQYYFGTTDVTRTISLNNKSKNIKNIFTRVLKGHIAVSKYKLTPKTTGSEIDKSARKYLKQINLDYAHGTGHGVGYFLNVHEGPQGISRFNKVKLKKGMIISNEPGYYKSGNFGIRIENLILINKLNQFEDLTMAPIDKSLIVKNLLTKNEVKWLNNYHVKVFNNLKSFMNKNQLEELKESCSNI
jgi:Xaa-Pro aminopeptidase